MKRVDGHTDDQHGYENLLNILRAQENYQKCFLRKIIGFVA